MVIQNPGTIGKKLKKGGEVAAFPRFDLPNDLLNLAFLQLKRSYGMRFETNQSGNEKQKLKKYKVKIK